MAEVPDRRIIDAEYPPEDAGQKVGWVSVVSKENVGQCNVETVDINAGVAHVSEQGASRGYTLRNEDGKEKKIVFPGDVGGFEDSASVHIETVRGMSLKEVARESYIDLTAHNSKRHATCMLEHVCDEETGVIFTIGAEDLIAALKKHLKKEDASDLYPIVYYGLNAAIGHAGVREFLGSYISTKENPPFVADPQMQDVTEAQLAASETIAADLSTIKDEDETMKSDLTVFSSISADQVPDAFVASRQKVHETEARAIECANTDLLIPSYSFLPVGFRPGGRSWPYMDATLDASDERAFGRELEGLKYRAITPADYELKKEIQETSLRLQYAQATVKMLRDLLAAEQAG